MQHSIIVAGKPSLHYAKLGTQEYLKRLTRYGKYNLTYVKDGSSEAVSERLALASQNAIRVVLDERGKLPSTRAFLKVYNQWEMQGVKKICFLIGASDGHTEALRQQADYVLALSALTLQHELALLVLMEQIYRLACIKRGTPYHRD